MNYSDDDDNNKVLGHFTVKVPGANILLFSSSYFQIAHRNVTKYSLLFSKFVLLDFTFGSLPFYLYS